jgi:hypothetical protein
MQKESGHLDLSVKVIHSQIIWSTLLLKSKLEITRMGHVEGVKAQYASTYRFGKWLTVGPLHFK